MNIIEHLTRTVTPIVLGNLQGNQVGDRPSLLEKVYAIMVARLADNNISTPLLAVLSLMMTQAFLTAYCQKPIIAAAWYKN